MAEERLTRSEKLTLAAWIFAGVAAVFFAHHYFFRAFPEASVNFSVSRDEAVQRARDFIGTLGENVSGYQSAAAFGVDDNAKTYLEREVGLQQANQLMSSVLHIWYWRIRFFKPGQEQEFQVLVTPAGTIAGYSHKVEESLAGATLDRDAAQDLAQGFLTRLAGINLADWNFLPEEMNSTKRPNRLDWSFTWEKRGFRAKDAPYRLRVLLQGNRIGGSQEFLRVPEEWERGYSRLRSGNDTLASVFLLPYMLLLAAAVWLGISFLRRGQTSWGPTLKLGAVVAAVLFFMQLNEWPIDRMGYNTNAAYGSFVFEIFVRALLFGVGSSLMVVLVLPAAEPLYRSAQPGRLRLSKALSLPALRTKEFFCSAVIGLSMAAAHIGYVVAFYMIAAHYGAWAPQEISYENSVATNFPWIAGIGIGLLASTSEEFTFRMLAIPLLTRLTRSRWVAVIVPAFLWSFLHSNYPQEPPYMRGIEIGIVGIVAGIVMLRWGILTTLIWHYTVDASLVGLFLLRSNSLYFRASGAIVAAAAFAPLAYSAISYWRRGGFEQGEALLNRAEPVVEPPAAEQTADQTAAGAHRYDPLSIKAIACLVICLVVGGVLTWRVRQPGIGDYLKLPIDAKGAQANADLVLRQRGLNPLSFHHSAVLTNRTDALVNEFLRRRIGIAALNKIYATQVPGALWLVRFFRDSQPEEYSVVLKPDGSLHSIHHTLAESTPGPSLSKEDAIARAERYLRDEKKLDLSQWTLVDSKSDKLPHRTDHILTWQQSAPLDPSAGTSSNSSDRAFERIDVAVLGDEVANFRTYIKIPDEWRRKQEQESTTRTVYGFLPLTIAIVLGLIILIVYLKSLRAPSSSGIPWKRVSLWGILGPACFLANLGFGSGYVNYLQQYRTALPFKLFLVVFAIGIIFYCLVIVGAVSLLYGLAWHFASRAFGEERVPAWLGMPSSYYRDALWIGLGGAGALLGINHLVEAFFAYKPMLHRAFGASFAGDFDAILPAAAIAGRSVLSGLFETGIVALVGGFVVAEIRSRWLRLGLLLLSAFALVGSDWITAADFTRQLVVRIISLTLLILGIRWLMRLNSLGCFLVVTGTSLLGGALPLLHQPAAFYRANGYAVLLALALLYAIPFVAWRARGPATNA